MKISTTYRFIASLLSLTIALSVVSPTLGFAGMMEHCAEMMEISDATESSMHDHDAMSHSSMKMSTVMEMNTDKDCCMTNELMNYHQTNKEEPSSLTHCEMSIDCNCGLSGQAIQKDALLLQQIKIPILSVSYIETDLLKDQNDPSPIPIYFSISYSPPLLFLANESLLI